MSLPEVVPATGAPGALYRPWRPPAAAAGGPPGGEANMAAFIGEVVINVTDLDRAVRFWTAALDYVSGEVDPEFIVLRDPRRRGVSLTVQLWDTPKDGVNRVHLDLYARDVRAEADRLVGLGARRTDWEHYPEGSTFVVLTDPDGNEFCIVSSDATQD